MPNEKQQPALSLNDIDIIDDALEQYVRTINGHHKESALRHVGSHPVLNATKEASKKINAMRSDHLDDCVKEKLEIPEGQRIMDIATKEGLDCYFLAGKFGVLGTEKSLSNLSKMYEKFEIIEDLLQEAVNVLKNQDVDDELVEEIQDTLVDIATA